MSALGDTVSDTYSGGFPTISQDLGPCILYAILYTIPAGLCGWRLVTQYRYSKRMLGAFIRIAIFQLVRITTFIIRAVDAKNITDVIEGKGKFNRGLFIAEQVFLSIGWLWLASTLSKFTLFHDLRGHDWKTAKKQRRFTTFIDLILFAATTLLSATAYDYSNRKYREVSTILALIALVLLFGYNVYLMSQERLPKKTTYWLLLTILFLIIVPCYRLSTLFNPPDDSSSDGRKAEFYVLQVTIEWLVDLSILGVNAMEWCGVEKDEKKSKSVESVDAYEKA